MRRRNICAICRQQQRPPEFNSSFNPRREICHYCGQPDFGEFYVREDGGFSFSAAAGFRDS